MDMTETEATVETDLSLCEFLRLVACMSDEELCLDRFDALVRRLHLPQELLEQHMHYEEESYARNLIVLTPRFEMLMMCWKPGQLSTVHDHLDSFALVRVIKGTLFNEYFNRVDDGSVDGEAELEKTCERLDTAGNWVNMDHGGIHRMGCRADATENLATLHFYARPLREINVFDVEARKVELVRLRYSLLHF